MQRILVTGLLSGLLLSITTQVDAGGWLKCAMCQFWNTTLENNRWPEPYIFADSEEAYAPFEVMVHNGWRRQNTLTDDHFQENGVDLAENGVLKVRWILLQAPEEFRTVYVQRTGNNEVLAARIEAVRQLASEVLPAGEVVAVMETNTDPIGWPAEFVDQIDNRWRTSAPEPRLPSLVRPETD